MSAPKRGEAAKVQDERFDSGLRSKLAARVNPKTPSPDDDWYVALRERVIGRFPKTLARLAK